METIDQFEQCIAVEGPSRSFVSLNELERMYRENPISYLVDGLLPADDVHVAVGDSGLGKTPLAYQLGLCVSSGLPFLDHPVRQGRVLYIDMENGPKAVLEVARSLCAHLGIEAFPSDFLFRSDEAIPDLEDIVIEYQPSLVIVDTLRPFRPGAETKNDGMGRFLNTARAVARSGHCCILLLHHIKKPGENGVQPLEQTPTLEWLLQASGARSLINQTNTRIAFDYQRNTQHPETALVMKWHVKMKGESGLVYLERVCDEAGAPIGYRRMVGPTLLGNTEQEAAYERLPEEFTFKEAKHIYGKTDDPARKFLVKCIGVGILEQPARGRYRKRKPIESVEKIERPDQTPSATTIDVLQASAFSIRL